MRQRTMSTKTPAEKAVRDIRRKMRKQYSVEEKIRIILDGLRGEESVAARCRRDLIGPGHRATRAPSVVLPIAMR